MRFSAVAIVAVAVMCLEPGLARGEQHEKRIVATGLAGFPVFTADNPVGFGLHSWGGGLGFEYSLLHEFWVGGQLSITRFAGATPDFAATIEGRDYTGDLSFIGRYYHAQLTARYELLSGWDVAPHLELAAGYMVSHYGTASLVDDENRLIVDGLPADSSGGLSVQGTFLVNWRLINMLQVGLGISYLHVFDGLHHGAVQIPLRFSFYWY